MLVLVLIHFMRHEKERGRRHNVEVGVVGAFLPLLTPSFSSFPLIFFHTHSISSFIWAFMGQSLFLEIMAEMKQPKEFEKSLVASNSVMFAVYICTAIIGYYYKGSDVRTLPHALISSTAPFSACMLLFFRCTRQVAEKKEKTCPTSRRSSPTLPPVCPMYVSLTLCLSLTLPHTRVRMRMHA